MTTARGPGRRPQPLEQRPVAGLATKRRSLHFLNAAPSQTNVPLLSPGPAQPASAHSGWKSVRPSAVHSMRRAQVISAGQDLALGLARDVDQDRARLAHRCGRSGSRPAKRGGRSPSGETSAVQLGRESRCEYGHAPVRDEMRRSSEESDVSTRHQARCRQAAPRVGRRAHKVARAPSSPTPFAD